MGHLLHGPHGETGAALRIGRVELDRMGGAFPPGDQVAVCGHHGVTVARQTHHAHPGAVGGNMEDHDRVGTVTGRPAEVVRGLLGRCDPVPAVRADEQHIHAAAVARTVLYVPEGIDPADVVQPADDRVPDAARAQHQDGQRGGHRGCPAGPCFPPAAAGWGHGGHGTPPRTWAGDASTVGRPGQAPGEATRAACPVSLVRGNVASL